MCLNPSRWAKSAALATLLLCAAGQRVEAKVSPEQQQQLDAANRRWRGAPCRTRQLLEVKKGRDGDGWSKCKNLSWDEKHPNRRVHVLVSDGEAIHRTYAKGVIPLATDLKIRGWEVDQSNNLRLELELVDVPVQGRVYFCDHWVGRVSVKRLADFERWARYEFLEMVKTPDEQLVDAAPTPPAFAAPPTPVSEVPPTVTVLAASTEPTSVAPGEPIRLVVHYSIDGSVPPAGVAVVERRTIVKDQRELTTVEASATRAAGLHTSKQAITVPASLSPGVYHLKVTVALGPTAATGTAIFEVR